MICLIQCHNIFQSTLTEISESICKIVSGSILFTIRKNLLQISSRTAQQKIKMESAEETKPESKLPEAEEIIETEASWTTDGKSHFL